MLFTLFFVCIGIVLEYLDLKRSKVNSLIGTDFWRRVLRIRDSLGIFCPRNYPLSEMRKTLIACYYELVFFFFLVCDGNVSNQEFLAS